MSAPPTTLAAIHPRQGGSGAPERHSPAAADPPVSSPAAARTSSWAKTSSPSLVPANEAPVPGVPRPPGPLSPLGLRSHPPPRRGAPGVPRGVAAGGSGPPPGGSGWIPSGVPAPRPGGGTAPGGHRSGGATTPRPVLQDPLLRQIAEDLQQVEGVAQRLPVEPGHHPVRLLRGHEFGQEPHRLPHILHPERLQGDAARSRGAPSSPRPTSFPRPSSSTGEEGEHLVVVQAPERPQHHSAAGAIRPLEIIQEEEEGDSRPRPPR